MIAATNGEMPESKTEAEPQSVPLLHHEGLRSSLRTAESRANPLGGSQRPPEMPV